MGIHILYHNKLYKSIDSGQNWIIVGDSLFNSLNHSIKDIKLNPDDNQHLFVASNHGLFVSNNGGYNFNNMINGIVQEIEFCPSSSDTIYAINQTGDSTGASTMAFLAVMQPSPLCPKPCPRRIVL